MTNDDPIAEIRAIRDALARRFDYDIDRLFDFLAEERKKRGDLSAKTASRKVKRKSLKAKIATAGE